MGMLSHGPDFRPEVPERLEDLPGGTFGGIHDYIQLMRDCWAEARLSAIAAKRCIKQAYIMLLDHASNLSCSSLLLLMPLDETMCTVSYSEEHELIQQFLQHPEDRPDFPAVAEQLRQIMGQEALLRRERSERRNSSLGTEHSNSGLLSFGNSTQPPTTDQESGSDRS